MTFTNLESYSCPTCNWQAQLRYDTEDSLEAMIKANDEYEFQVKLHIASHIDENCSPATLWRAISQIYSTFMKKPVYISISKLDKESTYGQPL